MRTLQQIWDSMPLKSDKGDVHSYLSVYDEILLPYRETAKNILEVGLFNGASFKMFVRYFSGHVYGIDCSDTPHGGMADLRPMLRAYNIFIGDAENPNDVDRFFKDISFDVIIEDAAHNISQQLKIYSLLKPYLNKNAIYIIEDIQNIDVTRKVFEYMDSEKEITILDRRSVKGRYDDCLVIIKDKA